MNVSWEDVTDEYLPWLSRTTGHEYRLPGEAEQEYVLRAGGQSRFPWGDDESAACAYANGGRVTGCDDGHGFTSPVGTLQANAFGLHDTSGNVWEWSADCWRKDYSDKNRNAPASPDTCRKRVLRGGSWDSAAIELRSADRFWDAPAYRFSVTGFRVARNLSP
jgi:formylglycine-generating enzyme required for sulfatase activity